jgi:hypothetical protein
LGPLICCIHRSRQFFGIHRDQGASRSSWVTITGCISDAASRHSTQPLSTDHRPPCRHLSRQIEWESVSLLEQLSTGHYFSFYSGFTTGAVLYRWTTSRHGELMARALWNRALVPGVPADETPRAISEANLSTILNPRTSENMCTRFSSFAVKPLHPNCKERVLGSLFWDCMDHYPIAGR